MIAPFGCQHPANCVIYCFSVARLQNEDVFDLIVAILFPQLTKAGVNALDARRRAGEQGLFEAGLEQLPLSFGLIQIHLQLHLCKDIVGVFFLCGSFAAFQLDPPFQEGAADLIFHVLLKPAHAQALDIFADSMIMVSERSARSLASLDRCA